MSRRIRKERRQNVKKKQNKGTNKTINVTKRKKMRQKRK